MPNVPAIRTLALLGLPALPIAMSGQNVSFGVIGGVSLGDDFRTRFERPSSLAPGYSLTTGSNGYLVGPAIELRLRPRLSVGVDALYRPLSFTQATVLADGTLNSVSPATVVTWQFPVLTKYRFTAGHRVMPFVEAGPSFRTAGNLNGTDPSHYGITAGVGAEVRAAKWIISPRVRHTRWARDRELGVESLQNRTELLVAFSRPADSNWRPLGSRFSVGVIAGATITDDFRSTTFTSRNFLDQQTITYRQSSGPRVFSIGPMVEAVAGRAFSVQASAIYRPLHLQTQVAGSGTPRAFTSKWSTWQFPVLVRYRVSDRTVTPVVELGPSFRRRQEILGSKLSAVGVTAGAGVDARLGRFRLSPALRYTHWGPESRSGQSGKLRNELAVLVGLSL
jgi:hypothetical protein